MNNLPIILEYLTSQLGFPNVAGVAYDLIDNSDGNGIQIDFWNENPLGARPTQEEIEAAEADALAWHNGGFEEDAGKFAQRLPMSLQAKFNKLVIDGDISAITLDKHFSRHGATIDTKSPKTIGGVMYLTGAPIPDESGEIHQLEEPILTVEQAQAWLAGEKVEV